MASGVLRHEAQTVGHQHTDGWAVDLEEALKQTIAGEVRFDRGGRALYATDLSIYRQMPVGVVIPRTLDDVVVRQRNAVEPAFTTALDDGFETARAVGRIARMKVKVDPHRETRLRRRPRAAAAGARARTAG